MTTLIACSACNASFAAGPTTCPNCGLPLTAQARPVTKQPWPIWVWILGAFLVLLVVGQFADSLQREHDERIQKIFLADLNAGHLATPAAFEARCGLPQSVTQTRTGPELHYYNGGDYYVTFVNGHPALVAGHIDIDGNNKVTQWRSRVGDDFYFSALHCK